ncbi:MAG: hypothetical protein WCW17_00075 [Patescibacteria group bacterium]|jgi:hypothetical protein
MDPDEIMRIEHRRQQVIEKAVTDADRIIMYASGDENEKINSLTIYLAALVFEHATSRKSGDKNTEKTISGRAPAEAMQAIHDAIESAIDASEIENSPIVRRWIWYQIMIKFMQKVAIQSSSAIMMHDSELEPPHG